MEAMEAETEYIVIGGGEWGCHHAGLLLRAMRNGRLAPATVHAVDRDPACAVAERFAGEELFRFTRMEWLPFLGEYLGSSPPGGAQVVPSPHAPHLFLDWLESYILSRRPGAELRREPFEAELSLPFQYAGADNNLYLSAAAWECPISCREPRVCPAIRARRSWDIGEIIRARAAGGGQRMTAIVWKSEYVAPGVAAVPVAHLLGGAGAVLGDPLASGRAAVATVSSCHGVVSVLRYNLLPEGLRCA